MAMGFISAIAQPKKGTRSSSRLTTWLSGSKAPERKKVSQVLWCLARITQGRSGTFSSPFTS
ncbi:hypothetical protein D9M69_683000 [compost metagenome]